MTGYPGHSQGVSRAGVGQIRQRNYERRLRLICTLRMHRRQKMQQRYLVSASGGNLAAGVSFSGVDVLGIWCRYSCYSSETSALRMLMNRAMLACFCEPRQQSIDCATAPCRVQSQLCMAHKMQQKRTCKKIWFIG